MAEISKLEIKFDSLSSETEFVDYIGTGIPLEGIAETLKRFYAYKLGVKINNQDYENIKELEGILELHNLVKGKLDNNES